MADVNITGKIQVDADAALKQTLILKQEIKDLSTEFKNAKAGSDEQVIAYKKLSQAQKDLSDRTSEGSSAFSVLKDKITSTIPGFKGAEAGASSFGKELLILAANPIVLILTAIVGVLTLLYKAFTSTIAGAQKMEQIFESMKAAITVLTDRLVTFGNSIIKLFSGDFKGAADDAKAAFTGIGEAITKTAGRAGEIRKRLQEIAKEERIDHSDRLKRETELAKLREKLNDESVPISEKIAAQQKLSKAVEENQKDDLRRQREKSALEIELIHQKTNLSLDDMNRERELNDEITKTETDNALEAVRVNKVKRNLEKQSAAERKAEYEEQKKRDEEKKKAEEEDYKSYLKRSLSRMEDNRITVQMIRDEEARLEKEKTDKIKKEEDTRLQNQRDFLGKQRNILQEDIADNAAASQAKTEIYSAEVTARDELNRLIVAGLDAVSDLVGRNTQLGKGLAIASATISTYLSAQKAYASQISIATPDAPFRAALAAGVAVATGLAQIKNIVAVQIPGQGGGGSVPSGGSTPAPLTPAAIQTNTRLDTQSIQGIGNAATGGTVRAFVVENDVTNNQQRIATLNRAARLG